MTFTAVADIALGLAVVAVICVRQLRWTPLRPGRLWRLPLVLGALGVVSLMRGHGRPLSAADLALLLAELAVALGTGAAMGAITVFRAAVVQIRTGGVPAAITRR